MQCWAQLWGAALTLAVISSDSLAKPRRYQNGFRLKDGFSTDNYSNFSFDDGLQGSAMGQRGSEFKTPFGNSQRSSILGSLQSSNMGQVASGGLPYGYTQPNLGSSVGYQPSLGSSIGYQPNLGPSIGYQPNLGPSIGYQPTLGQSIGYQPSLGPSIGYQPSLGQSIGYQPSLGPSVGYQPSLGPSVGYQPTLGQSIGYQPSLGPSIGYQPTLGQSIGYQPSLGPSIGYQPSLGQSIGYQPSLGPSVGYQPSLGPSIGYQPTLGSPVGYPPAISSSGGIGIGPIRLGGGSQMPQIPAMTPFPAFGGSKSSLSASRAISSFLAADGTDRSSARAYISPGTYYPTFQGNPFAPPPFFGTPSTSTAPNVNIPRPVDLTQYPTNLISQQQGFQRPQPINLFPASGNTFSPFSPYSTFSPYSRYSQFSPYTQTSPFGSGVGATPYGSISPLVLPRIGVQLNK